MKLKRIITIAAAFCASAVVFGMGESDSGSVKKDKTYLTMAAVASSSGLFPYVVSIEKVINTYCPEYSITVSKSNNNVNLILKKSKNIKTCFRNTSVFKRKNDIIKPREKLRYSKDAFSEISVEIRSCGLSRRRAECDARSDPRNSKNLLHTEQRFSLYFSFFGILL